MPISTPLSFIKSLLGLEKDSSESLPKKRSDDPNLEPKTAPQENPAKLPSDVGKQLNKIALLRETLDLEQEISDQLQEVHTSRAMILFIYDNILFKFSTLHSLGILSDTTNSRFEAIAEKCKSLLSDQNGNSIDTDPDTLARENISLKRQLSAIYKKYVKSDIISGSEIQLEEERNSLQNRLEEANKRYAFAKKKIEALASGIATLEKIRVKYELLAANVKRAENNSHELEKLAGIVRELETRNKHLQSKLDHQQRLIQALSWDAPNSKNIFESLDTLSDEQEKLSDSLKMRDPALKEALAHLAESPDISRELTTLTDENNSLHSEISIANSTLDLKNPNRENFDLAYGSQELCDESIATKDLAESSARIIANLQNVKDETTIANLLKELKEENVKLKDRLAEKIRKIKRLMTDPDREKIIQKNVYLLKCNQRLQREVDNFNYIISTISPKCALLEKEVSKMKTLARENSYYKNEVSKLTNLLSSYKKIHAEHLEYKKLVQSLQSKLDTLKENNRQLTVQNSILEDRAAFIKSKYDGLIDEYNKLFPE